MNLNIQGVNYTSNVTGINQNINQSNQGQLQITVPGGLSSKEAGIALLQNLNAGDVFTGEITNITQNQITLALSDKVTVTATLANALSYNIGDTASFAIKDNSGEQIILKSLNSENMNNLMNDQTITGALRQANLAINETTVSLVHNLMKQGLPIDSESLNSYAKVLELMPNATPEDVVLMTKMDIPITKENVEAFHDYYNFNNSVADKSVDMMNELSNTFIEMSNDSSPAEVGKFIVDLTSSFSPVISNEEPMESFLSKEELTQLSDNIKELFVPLELNDEVPTENNTNPAINNFANKTEIGEAVSKEFLTDLSKLLNDEIINQDSLKKLISSDGFKKITDNFIRQEQFINPEDVDKDTVKRLFSKVIQDNHSLAENLSGNKAGALINSSQSLSHNVEFMNEINHFMSFVQIPIKMSGQNAHGDLYVYNKKGSADNKEDLKALLHLDMDNLGALDILVRLQDKNVTTNFKVESDEVLDYIEEHMDELNSALNKLGYNVNSSVNLNTTPYSFKSSVIEEELPPAMIKRFSFDVRA